MTTFRRRTFMHLAAGAVALPALSRTAWALDYPTRTVQLIVGYPASVGPDIVGRVVAGWLSERLGQQFAVENRPGAGSNIGAEIVVRSQPDGYTLLLFTASNAINVSLYQNLNFNFTRDIAPVASVAQAPFLMAVTPSLPAKTLPEFIAYAKANPGKINMASNGNGTAPHVFGELFMMVTGVKLLHIPYRSSFLPDLFSGRVQVVFAATTSLMEYVRTGKLRALGVTTTTRLRALPDVPSVSEFVAGYEATGWVGLGAPKNTPSAVIELLNNKVNAAFADPTFKRRLADLGLSPLSMTRADFEKFVHNETQKWAKVIEFAGIKA